MVHTDPNNNIVLHIPLRYTNAKLNFTNYIVICVNIIFKKWSNSKIQYREILKLEQIKASLGNDDLVLSKLKNLTKYTNI